MLSHGQQRRRGDYETWGQTAGAWPQAAKGEAMVADPPDQLYQGAGVEPEPEELGALCLTQDCSPVQLQKVLASAGAGKLPALSNEARSRLQIRHDLRALQVVASLQALAALENSQPDFEEGFASTSRSW